MKSQLLYEKKLTKGIFQVYSEQPSFAVKTVKQTHSDIVRDETEAFLEGDGILGSSSSPLGILTADCIPLVLIGDKAHAVIHAGWKGLQLKILQHPKIKSLNPTFAFIGPHIRVKNYEVQAEFKNNFKESDSFLFQSGKMYFDLTKEVISQLRQNYPKIEIEDCAICTFTEEKYNSFRRNKTPFRNWNVYNP